MAYFRNQIEAMHGYVPGEQPQDRRYVKLNTNENPYPPSERVAEVLRSFDVNRLGRYPDPVANRVRDAAADLHSTDRDHILAGNGSDDILTIALRAFVDQGGTVACLDPTYSLYPILADIQGASVRYAALDDDFQHTPKLFDEVRGASLLFLTRPNAPTGVPMPLGDVRDLCDDFAGIVLIDEAYADFAQDQADELVQEFDNVIISRTLSKSYSLAGIRFGYAYANPTLIAGMMKVKDSYNVSMLTQLIAEAALRDQVHMHANVHRIRTTREATATALRELGFQVFPSETNFLLARPPVTAAHFKAELQQRGVLVRHFSAPRISDYVRITIGTDDEMATLLTATRHILDGD